MSRCCKVSSTPAVVVHSCDLVFPRRTPMRSKGFARNTAVRRAVQDSAQSGASSSNADETPWKFGFQVNERYLSWDDAAARQLIKLVLAEKLDWEIEAVEAKLTELGFLVPDMVGKLECMRVDILAQMLIDLPAVAARLLVLREELPGINISSLVSRWPYIVLDMDEAALRARLQLMRAQLPGVRVELLVDSEPMLLKGDIPAVLQNIRRILPKADPVQVLVAQPQMVLDMTSAGMLSAVDVEGIPPKQHNK